MLFVCYCNNWVQSSGVMWTVWSVSMSIFSGCRWWYQRSIQQWDLTIRLVSLVFRIQIGNVWRWQVRAQTDKLLVQMSSEWVCDRMWIEWNMEKCPTLIISDRTIHTCTHNDSFTEISCRVNRSNLQWINWKFIVADYCKRAGNSYPPIGAFIHCGDIDILVSNVSVASLIT